MRHIALESPDVLPVAFILVAEAPAHGPEGALVGIERADQTDRVRAPLNVRLDFEVDAVFGELDGVSFGAVGR